VLEKCKSIYKHERTLYKHKAITNHTNIFSKTAMFGRILHVDNFQILKQISIVFSPITGSRK
jgi:hypothetical protein